MVWISLDDKEEDFNFAGVCVPKFQLESVYADTHHDHLCKLHVASRANMVRLSGIACMVGIATRETENIEKMIENGMNIAVLNLSRINSDYQHNVLQNIREANDNFSEKMRMVFPLAIGIVTRGSVGRIEFPLGGDSIEMTLYEEDIIKLTPDADYIIKENPPNTVYINLINLHKIIKVGNEIYIHGRRIKLVCVGVSDEIILCKVVNGGEIRHYYRVYLPGIPIDLPALSERDKTDISFAVENKLDIIFPAYIREKSHVLEIRELLGPEGKHIKIISQIENQQGMENLEEILEVSDGILVSREELGFEMDEEEIFLAQKSIIAKCNSFGKPVVCLVDMAHTSAEKKLQVHAAECCDIANSVLDGADCVFLDHETSTGCHPVECLQKAARICKQAELSVWQKRLFVELAHTIKPPAITIQAIAAAAVEISLKLLASAIIVISTSLKSAQVLVHYRPRCPVIAVTRSAAHARSAHLFRGILPLIYKNKREENWEEDVAKRVYYGINFGRRTGFITRGDPVVIMRCSKQGSGFTDRMQVIYTSRRISHATDCIC